MAEKFTLKVRWRNAAEIYLYERCAAAATVVVYSPCQQLLAGPAFTDYQHRGIGRSHTSTGVENIGERSRRPYDGAPVEAAVACRCLVQFQGGVDAFEKAGIVPWLGDEVESSGPHALDSEVDAAPCRHENYRYLRTEYLHLPQQSEPFDTRCATGEIHVHEHEVGALGTHIGHGIVGRWYCYNAVAGPRQQSLERYQEKIIVVDCQNYCHAANLVN